MLSQILTINDQQEEVEVDGKTYNVSLRFKRTYKDYSLSLKDVRKDDYLGTNTPMNYSSDVLVMDRKTRKVISAPGGSEPIYKDGKLQSMHQAQPVFKHVHDLYVDQEGAIYVGEWNAGQRHPYKLTPAADK